MAKMTVSLEKSPRAMVSSWITSAISKGDLSPGHPLPSERTLAKHLGVARKTVRAAIVDLIRAGVIAQGPAQRVRMIVGLNQHAAFAAQAMEVFSGTVVIVGGNDLRRVPLSHGWDASIQFHAAQLLDRSGHHVLSFNSNGRSGNDFEDLARLRPAGLLLAYDIADSPRGRALLADATRHGVPSVVHGDSPELSGYDRVTSDHEEGARALTRYLIERGRRRILRFWYVPDDREWLRQRDRGHERAMAESGLTPLPAVRLTHLGVLEPWTAAEFQHVTRLLAGYLSEYVLVPQPPDAIMLATDRHAYAVGAALKLLGKNPNADIALVGYDNTVEECVEREWETVGPIATVEKHNDRIAESLVQLLLDRIDNRLPQEPQRRIVVPTLVVPEGGDAGGENPSPQAG